MRGCLTCRLRHLKCDKSGAKCLRCQRSGRECVPPPAKSEEVSFRHGQNPSLLKRGPLRYGESDLAFPKDQVWVQASSGFSFKDETEETASEYHVLSIKEEPSTSRSPSESRSTPSSVTMDSGARSSAPVRPPYTRSNSASSLRSPPTPVGQPRMANVNEAYLLRHFQRYLAPWLDACDPGRHFSTEVAERALHSPLLLYACLAVSASHLSRTTNNIPSDVADDYHERCISIMLPVLDKPEFKISIDLLLASTVILRFFEQISSHSPPNDPQRHLLAGSVYISSHVDCAISGGLASAAFWLFVIQDIQFALTYQKCLRLSFAPFDDRLRRWWASKSTLSDKDWTNRAIWILAETIDFCYNVSGRNYGGCLGVAGENALMQRIAEWENSRPDTFAPLHAAPPDPARGKPFPEVWYMSSWHATAIQHICLTKALLSIRAIEQLDRSILITEQYMRLKAEITDNLNLLFGIGQSAEDDPSLRIMACHVLYACSAWIDNPLAQNVVFDLLRRTETENGWPWAYVEQRIVRAWRGVEVSR
ncbi:hypothetical protein N7474_010367 [Penicillium riverlandense]|uniref:uncharacterized protein n=1 Tax=Penicillium riverlandense TaxID=1903569 RepID=UPI0025497EC7|nr:uncharacterized protein N7474_010367 [Penicillium riverlandense]KAJ5806775.1 hypothetical protein N7474_010367 [Penicillium riverlandense]